MLGIALYIHTFTAICGLSAQEKVPLGKRLMMQMFGKKSRGVRLILNHEVIFFVLINFYEQKSIRF